MATAVESVNEVRWDLSVLYADIGDPRLDADLPEFAEKAKRFAALTKGAWRNCSGAAIQDYAEIDMLESKIGSYLFLREATDLANETIKARRAAVSAGDERDPRRAPHFF